MNTAKTTGGPGARVRALAVKSEKNREIRNALEMGEDLFEKNRELGEKLYQHARTNVNEVDIAGRETRADVNELRDLDPEVMEEWKRIEEVHESSVEFFEHLDRLETELLRRTDRRFLKVGEEFAGLKSEIATLKDRLKNQQTDAEKRISEAQSAHEQEVGLLQDELAETKRKTEKLMTLLKKEKDRVGRRDVSIQDLRDRHAEDVRKLNAKLAEEFDENETLTTEKANIQTLFDEARRGHGDETRVIRDTLTKTQGDRDSAIRAHQELEEKYRLLIEKHGEQIGQCDEEIRALRGKVDRMTQDQRQHVAIVMERSREIDDLKLKISTLQDSAEDAKRDLLTVSAELGEEKKRSELLSSEKDEMEGRIEFLEFALDGDKEGIESLRNSLNESEANRCSVLLENEKLKECVAENERRVDEERQSRVAEKAAADNAREKLKKQYAGMKAKAGELQSEVNKLKKKYFILEKDQQDSSLLIGEARAKAVTAQEDKAVETESLHLIEARLVRSELQRKTLSRSLSTVTSQSVARKETVDRLQIQIQALTRSNTAVASSRDTLQRRVEDLKRDLMLEVSQREALDLQLAAFMDGQKSAQSEAQSQSSTIAGLSRDRAALKTNLSALKHDLESKNRDLCNEREKVRDLQIELCTEKESLKQIEQQYVHTLRLRTGSLKEITHLRQRVEALQKKQGRDTQMVNDCKRKLREHMNGAANLSATVLQQNQAIDSWRVELEKARGELDKVFKSRNSLRSRFSSLKKDHDRTKAQLQSSTSELSERLDVANGEHTKEIASIRAECAQELDSMKIGFERELEGVRVEYRSSTMAAVAEKLRLQSEVNAVNSDYEDKISAIKTQQENLQQSLEAARLDYENRTRVIDAEKLDLRESLDAAKRNLNNTITAAATEKLQLQDEINTLKCTHEQQIKVISTQKLHLQERFDGADNAKIKLEADLKAATTENSNLRSQLKEAKDDKTRLQAGFRKFVDDREQAKKYLMSSLKKHVELDGLYDCSATSMTAAVKLYDESMTMAKDLLKELWEQSRTATTEYNRITRLHHAVLEECHDLSQSLETKEVELNQLTEKLIINQEQLADSKRSASALKADIAECQKQNERLKAATQLAFSQLAACSSSSNQSERITNELRIEVAEANRALSQEREHSKDLRHQREKAFTDVSMLQEDVNKLLKISESEGLIRGAISEELEQIKIERNHLREQLQTAGASIKALERDKSTINTNLQVSRHETRLARESVAMLYRDNPDRVSKLLGTKTNVTRAEGSNSNAIPNETGPPKPESAAASSPTQQPVLEDEEVTIPEPIDLTSDDERVEDSASSKAAGGIEKANTRAKRKHPGEEGIESASRLLGELIFMTNGIELRFNQFSEETRSNFARALAVVMEDHRTNVDAYSDKPHRKNCLACTSGHRSCDFKDGDDFACAWCESNSQLCVLRTEGSLYVLPRMQHETHDVYSERYWLAGQKVKKRRTGAQLLL